MGAHSSRVLRERAGILTYSTIEDRSEWRAGCPLQSWICRREKDIISTVLFGRALVVSEEPWWGTAKFPTTFVSSQWPSQQARSQIRAESPHVALRLQAEYIEFARGPYKNMAVGHRRNAELYSDARGLCAAVVEFNRKIRRIERVQDGG